MALYSHFYLEFPLIVLVNNKKKILRFISIPNHLFTFTHKKNQ